jgi:hypothetical protein
MPVFLKKKESTNNRNEHDVAVSNQITKTVAMDAYLVIDNIANKAVGNVYLTESQAYQLNKIMKCIDGKQNISFVHV